MSKLDEQYSIIGSSGYVGAHLKRHLESRSLPVWAPQRGDADIFKRRLGHVFYCAGYTQDYIADPLATLKAHITHLSEVLETADYDSLIYLSSVRLYDGLKGNVDEEADLILNPNQPRHLFDLTKAAAESVCINLRRQRIVVARLATVYDARLESTNFLSHTLRLALSKSDLEIETSLDTARDYVYIDDVCEALLALTGDVPHRIYNLASGQLLTNRRLFQIIERHTGVMAKIRETSAALATPRISNRRLRIDTKIVPRSFEDALPIILETAR